MTKSCEFTVRDLRKDNFVLSKRASSSIAHVYISGDSGVRDDGNTRAYAWLYPGTPYRGGEGGGKEGREGAA